ncbi:MAG: hypothetical protein GY711_25065 [bacterium]|nr:hypothetical protein [bacterium]
MLANTTLNWGPGNIDAEPLFNGPHRFLLPGSPCIDAGDNAAILADLGDIDGDGDTREPVPLDVALDARRTDDPGAPDTGNGSTPIVDMGAKESQ